MPNNIGVSRRQTVFVVKEDTKGTLKFPAATDFVLPAGDAVMNQTPAFTDSEEKRDTLDVLDQFQNALPAGTWNIPTYLRPSGTLGSVPQGDALFEALQGVKNPATTAAINQVGGIDADDVTLTYDTLAGGQFPERGIIQIGTEQIYYSGKTSTTLTGLTRGYNSTTAAAHLDDAAITLKSIVYRQATTSPSVSVWIKTDHFLQAMAGCTVNSCPIGVNNEGAVTLDFQGEGMVMGWAGSDPLAGDIASNASTLSCADASKYSAGMYIWNETLEDDNGGAGYLISTVDTTLNLLTIGSPTSQPWKKDDIIAGYLPTGTVIGDPTESRHTTVEINGASAKFRGTDYTIGVPKQYIIDEVGTDAPEDYLEQTRNISSTLNLYFRRDEAHRFYDGYQGSEVPIELVFGDAVGKRMAMYLKRCKLEVPTISFENPAVALSMGLKALGTVGEDSCEIRFE